jgi:transcriptional regulator with XRE-family HTH domain
VHVRRWRRICTDSVYLQLIAAFHDSCSINVSTVGIKALMLTSGVIIRMARLRAGLSQTELADRSGKDRAQIARWERDGVMPGFETLVEVVRACGFDVSLELVPLVIPNLPQLAETAPLTPKERLDRMLARRLDPPTAARDC